MCPLVSRAMANDESALEAAALDMHGAADVFRLGLQALVGDWRASPNVEAARCQRAILWAARGIPAILDGETVQLKTLAEIRFTTKIARTSSRSRRTSRP